MRPNLWGDVEAAKSWVAAVTDRKAADREPIRDRTHFFPFSPFQLPPRTPHIGSGDLFHSPRPLGVLFPLRSSFIFSPFPSSILPRLPSQLKRTRLRSADKREGGYHYCCGGKGRGSLSSPEAGFILVVLVFLLSCHCWDEAEGWGWEPRSRLG